MPTRVPSTTEALQSAFGNIDIYLFDQLLRGNIRPGMRVLDAGCGGGRNLVYLLRAGYDVWALDREPERVEAVRRLSKDLDATLDEDHLRVAEDTAIPWPDASFEVVISNAVLHFSKDRDSFSRSVDELGRVLTRGGLLWVRLATTIGIEERVAPLGGGRYRLPDGSERFCVGERELLDLTARLRGALVDPIKTTVVQGLRAMTTWVVRKT